MGIFIFGIWYFCWIPFENENIQWILKIPFLYGLNFTNDTKIFRLKMVKSILIFCV